MIKVIVLVMVVMLPNESPSVKFEEFNSFQDCEYVAERMRTFDAVKVSYCTENERES